MKEYRPEASFKTQLSLGGKSLDEVESLALVETLKQTKGNKSEASKILNITRTTLNNKMKRYHLSLNRILPKGEK